MKMKLTQEEARDIDNLLYNFSNTRTCNTSKKLVYSCIEATRNLPERLKKRLFMMKMRGEPYLLLRGLPMSVPVKKTPLTQQPKSQADFYYQNIITIISSLLGYFYKFDKKKVSSFVDDIIPIEADKHEQMGTNSVRLDWHVEDAFHQARADYVCLLCLRADSDAKTLLCRAKVLLQALPISARQELAQAKYLMRGDNSFQQGYNFVRQSYVLEESDDPEIIFDPSFMESTDTQGKVALEILSKYIKKKFETIILNEGDLLIFDNRRVVHSRTSYTPRYDGSDRWLLRTLVVESTWKLKNKLSNKFLTVN